MLLEENNGARHEKAFRSKGNHDGLEAQVGGLIRKNDLQTLQAGLEGQTWR